MTTELTKANPTVTAVKNYLSNIDVRARFESILGKKAPQFMGSVVNVVAGNRNLQECDAQSIMGAAFVAASFDLPIDQNLGFAAIVPYKGKAQFQMMYKGFIQLSIRSAQYRSMNYSDVYEDELLTYNPITKEVSFVAPLPTDGQRSREETQKIVGYFACFELHNGFRQSLYMSCEEIRAHAAKYSKSYQYDLREKKQSSRWSTDFDVMAKKTVIKLLLSKWGIMSIDIQRALTEDQKVFTSEKESAYLDSPENDAPQIQATEMPRAKAPEQAKPETKAPTAAGTTEPALYATPRQMTSLQKLAAQAGLKDMDYFDFLADRCENPDKPTSDEYQVCMKDIAAKIDEVAKGKVHA